MLVYGCEDGFTGYNRLVPLGAFAFGERIPLVDIREASRPARVTAVWGSALLVAAACAAWPLLGERPSLRRSLLVAVTTLVFAVCSLGWGRNRPQRLAYTKQCSSQRIAPPVLLAEWFLTFASAWAMTRLDLAPLAALRSVRLALAAADVVLIPLALLPFANALWFLATRRARAAGPGLRLLK